QQEPPVRHVERLFVADLPKVGLDVGPPKEEIAVALDVGHRNAPLPEPVDGVQDPADLGGLELRVGDEKMEDVPQKGNRAGSSVPRALESLPEWPVVPRATPH